MEELKQLCEHGSSTISIARDWEHLTEARELLNSYGYVEQAQEEEDDDSVIFQTTTTHPQESLIQFPKETLPPQYKSSTHRSSASSSPTLSEWTNFAVFQHDTNAKQLKEVHQLRLTARTPKASVQQTVGIKMLVQPIVRLDNAHFNVKLRVEKLVVGVLKDDFLKLENHCLGYYPYSIRIDMEPLVDNYESFCAIPTLDPRLPDSSLVSSAFFNASAASTSIGAQLGYGPASLNISHTWSTERGEFNVKKVELVHVDEAEGGNAASFEWSILRWESNEKYDAKKPVRGVKWGKGKVQLPFKGGAVSVEKEIPDVHWRFAKEVRGKVVRFKIKIQAEMHLVWWQKNAFVRSVGHSAVPFSYENVWQLRESCP